jgi:hypothetical protein
MPRRSNISTILLLAAMACCCAASAVIAQVATEKPLHLARVAGYVVNVSGKPVAHADVTLTKDDTVAYKTTTDDSGAFHFDHVLGHFWLRIARTENAPAAREIEVGDLVESYLVRRKLYIIVGPGACADACSSVFTSKSEFEKAIRKKNKH